MAYVNSNSATNTAATSGSATLTGTSIGDVVLVLMVHRATAGGAAATSITNSSGLTQMTGSPFVTGTGTAATTITCWYKVLASAETSWSFTWTGSVQFAWCTAAYSGRHQTTPIDAIGIALRATESTALVYGGVTPTVNNCDIVWFGGWGSSVSSAGVITPDAGFTATERRETGGGAAVQNMHRVHLLDETQTTATATGNETATAGNGYYGYAGAIALAPPPATSDTTPPAAPTGLTGSVIL